MKWRIAIIASLLSFVFVSGCALWSFEKPAEQLAAINVGLTQAVKLNTDLLKKKSITPDKAEKHLNSLEKAGGWAVPDGPTHMEKRTKSE